MRWVIKKSIFAIGNLYWKIFGGLILSVVWAILAAIFLVSIIGAPLTLPCLRAAWLSYKPFGKEVAVAIDRPVLSVIWMCTAGLALTVLCVISMLSCLVTLVGLPLLKQWWKVTATAVLPFCCRIV